MYIKVKHILIVVLIIFVSALFIWLFKNNTLKNNVLKEFGGKETEGDEIDIHNMKYSYPEMLELLIKKNSDWSGIPLSKNFKEKYNSEEGILRNVEFNQVELNPSFGGKYPFEDTAYFVITQGLKKTAYSYQYVFDNNKLLDDVLLPEVYNLTDEYGNEMDYRISINEQNFSSKFGDLAFGGEYEQCIGVTDNFHKKYPYFLDLFIHYSPSYEITFIEEKSSWEKKEAYFEVDGTYECIKRHYIVNFLLDDKGYLDDVKVNLVGEYPYEKAYLSHASLQVIYKNSNWDYIKLTDKFRNKYSDKNSLFGDIDNINIDNIHYEYIKDDFDMIMQCEYLDKIIKWYYIDYTYNHDDYLDDVEILPIDYNGDDVEEAKEAYIKQYDNN